VEVGHLQDKFIGHFSPHIVQTSAARLSLRRLVAKVGNISIKGLQLQLCLLKGRGSAELVEKVVPSNTVIVQ
jgi:hypothetical protein